MYDILHEFAGFSMGTLPINRIHCKCKYKRNGTFVLFCGSNISDRSRKRIERYAFGMQALDGHSTVNV